jgi:hypothetical protein
LSSARTIFRFAIALLLIGVTLSESHAQRNKRGQDTPQAAKQGGAQDQRGTEKVPLIVKTVPAEKSDAETKADKEKEDEHRYNETWLTKYTELLAWFTLGLVGVGIGQAVMFFVQLRYMRRGMRDAEQAACAALKSAQAAETQARIAERALVASERAWVSVDVRINSDLTFDSQGSARIGFSFTLNNVGRSPATRVQVHSKMFITTPTQGVAPPTDEVEEYTRFRSERIAPESQQDFLSYVVFPGDHPREISVIQTINHQQIEDAKEAWRQMAPGVDFKYIAVSVIGCVTYRTTLDNVVHHTGFLMWLRRRRTDISSGMLNLEERAVPVDGLALYHSPLTSPSID